jgi:hypothetical protein
MDLPTLLVLGAIAAMVLWASAVMLGRTKEMPIGRGLVNGLIVSVVIFVATVAIVTFLYNGRGSTEISFDLGGAFALGLAVGSTLAVGFFALGVALMPLGLLFRLGERWPSFGTWIAVPIVFASAGLAVGAFNAGRHEQAQPTSVQGSMSIEISGQQLGSTTAGGPAVCQESQDGSFTVTAGMAPAGGALTASNGQPAGITLSVDGAGSILVVQIGVGTWQAFPGRGWEPGPNTTALAAGWTRQAGRMTLSNLVPLNPQSVPDPTERWNGTLSWTCAS